MLDTGRLLAARGPGRWAYGIKPPQDPSDGRGVGPALCGKSNRFGAMAVAAVGRFLGGVATGGHGTSGGGERRSCFQAVAKTVPGGHGLATLKKGASAKAGVSRRRASSGRGMLPVPDRPHRGGRRMTISLKKTEAAVSAPRGLGGPAFSQAREKFGGSRTCVMFQCWLRARGPRPRVARRPGRLPNSVRPRLEPLE